MPAFCSSVLPLVKDCAFGSMCINLPGFGKVASGLQEGDIVERGTHQQLVQMGGLYAEMWTRQAEAAVVEEIGTTDETGTIDDKSNGDVSDMAAAHGSSNSLMQ